MLRSLLLTASILFSTFSAFAQFNPEWSKPTQPFRIAGNLYYVGTYDLSSYLITTSAGNILINTGLADSKEQILNNIKTLGFDPAKIRVLLTTQAHFDHMAAMAAIQQLTGAKMMVDRGDSSVVADGGKSDYTIETTYEPVKIDRILTDRDTIQLGETVLTMLHHPGHTIGSCSFLLDVKDESKTYRVMIANMPTIVTDKKFSEVKTYPQIKADFAYTLREMKKVKFDLWVASHASQFDMHKKRKPNDKYNPAAFAGRKDYDAYLKELQQAYDKKVKQDQ